MPPTHLYSPSFFQSHLQEVQSRRLLIHTPLYTPPSSIAPLAASPAFSVSHGTSFSSLKANIVLLLAALLCALIITLVVTAVVRCAVRVITHRPLWPRQSPEQPCTTTQSKASARSRKKALRALPSLVYSPAGLLDLRQTAPECVICLSEFIPGERLRVLPECNHGFHVRCIDRWLVSRSSCPTCRRCLFGECDEIAGGADGPEGSSTV